MRVATFRSTTRPGKPVAEALPVVGDYFASAITATEKALASLRDLDAPAGMKAQLDSFTAAMAAQLANAKEQIAAAKRSDVAGFTATLATASETIETFDQAAGALGAESAARDRDRLIGAALLVSAALASTASAATSARFRIDTPALGMPPAGFEPALPP